MWYPGLLTSSGTASTDCPIAHAGICNNLVFQVFSLVYNTAAFALVRAPTPVCSASCIHRYSSGTVGESCIIYTTCSFQTSVLSGVTVFILCKGEKLSQKQEARVTHVFNKLRHVRSM